MNSTYLRAVFCYFEGSMEKNFHQRNLKEVSWYWVDKTIVQEYIPKIGCKGLAVYSFLASFVDCNQRCFPSQKYIAQKLGCSRSTVNKAVKVLAKYRLIKIEKKSRYHCTYLLLNFRCNTEETQVSRRGNLDVLQMNTNDTKRIKNINNIDKRKNWVAGFKASEKFKPRTREELLAIDLARDLDDYQGLPFYIYLSKNYPESLLRKILGQVKNIPQDKIKKSRGALFNYLIQKNKGKWPCP
jgi:hypothetical protein